MDATIPPKKPHWHYNHFLELHVDRYTLTRRLPKSVTVLEVPATSRAQKCPRQG